MLLSLRTEHLGQEIPQCSEDFAELVKELNFPQDKVGLIV